CTNGIRYDDNRAILHRGRFEWDTTSTTSARSDRHFRPRGTIITGRIPRGPGFLAMLTIAGGESRYCDGLSRRSWLRIGGLALGGLSLPEILRAQAANGVRKQAKGVIMVLLPGGPTHLDMYDLKPDAPAEIRGEFRPIATNVPGIEICELMPRLAGMA